MMKGKDGKFISSVGYYHKDLNEVWQSMKKRCYSKTAINYERYGGRGIEICSEWKDNVMNFYKWALNNGWKKGLQLDRIDNNKGYSPENCRFVTPKENANNRRSNFNVSYKGKTQSLKLWTEELNISYPVVHKRITRLGWNIIDALETPVRKHKIYINSLRKELI